MQCTLRSRASVVARYYETLWLVVVSWEEMEDAAVTNLRMMGVD